MLVAALRPAFANHCAILGCVRLLGRSPIVACHVEARVRDCSKLGNVEEDEAEPLGNAAESANDGGPEAVVASLMAFSAASLGHRSSFSTRFSTGSLWH